MTALGSETTQHGGTRAPNGPGKGRIFPDEGLTPLRAVQQPKGPTEGAQVLSHHRRLATSTA